MTRAGVGYVAMVAAGVSAGVLGYAVIWSYEPEAAPPIAMAAPPGPPLVIVPPVESHTSPRTVGPRMLLPTMNCPVLRRMPPQESVCPNASVL